MIPSLLLGAVLAPQSATGGVSAGDFTGTPATMFFSPATIDVNYPAQQPAQSNGQFKYGGTATAPPGDHPSFAPAGTGTAIPDFSPGIVPWANQPVEIDAFTTNVNWLSIDTTSHELTAAGSALGWTGLLFSVTRDTQGRGPQNATAIFHESATGDVGADLFEYLVPGSTNTVLNPDETYRALETAEIALGPGTSREDAPELVAFDVSIPFILNSPNVFPQLLAGFEGVAFSVTAASAPSVPAGWIAANPSFQGPITGATIFVSLWDGQWSTPFPALGFDDLGLGPDADVDALAWDLDLITAPQRPQLLMFSTTSGTPDPLMYVDVAALRVNHTVKIRRGGQQLTLSEGIGLRPIGPGGVVIDDVDGICVLDPRFWNYARAVGTMAPGTGWGCVQASCFRTVDTLVTVLTRPLCTMNGASFATLMLDVQGSAVPIHSAFYDGSAPIDYAWSPGSSLIGIQIGFRWDILDAQGAAIANTPWVRVDV